MKMFLLRPSFIPTIFLFLLSTQAFSEATKYEAKLSAKISGPSAKQVWPYLADFCNLYKIFPSDVSFCVEGRKGQTGQFRWSAGKSPSPSPSPSPGNSTIVLWAHEKLLAKNPTKRFVTYQILENNRGLNGFIGTMQVMPISRYACRFKWTIVVDPVDGVTYEDFIAQVNATLDLIVEKIENLFGAN